MSTDQVDTFMQVVDALVAAATTADLDAIPLPYDAPAEHHALAELRHLQIGPTAGEDVLDTAALAALLQTDAAEVAAASRPGDLDHHRLERIAAWALARNGRVPRDPRGWPCERCDAGPGQSCALGYAGVHVGRGFRIGLTHPGETGVIGRANPTPTDRCVPSIEHGPGRVNRGRCLGCGWRGEPVDGESAAVEGAHDHAFPGWRDLPAVPALPQEFDGKTASAQKATARWWAGVVDVFPDGWLAAGGPIRTERVRPGSRHVPGRAPGGGYDLAIVLEAPRAATLHDLEPLAPTAPDLDGLERSRRACAASGHARTGVVEPQGRTYCRCRRASYELNLQERRAWEQEAAA